LKSLPSRTIAGRSHRRIEVSRFEPYPLRITQGDAGEIRSSPVYAGHAIKPLLKLAFRQGFDAGACSLGQDRDDPASRPSLLIFVHQSVGLPSSEQSIADVQKEWSPIDLGFRNASTDVPATASTPGNGSLTGLFDVAKRFLRSGIFYAGRCPARPRLPRFEKFGIGLTPR
jgi:hypothetical protein